MSLTRRELIQSAAVAAPALGALGTAALPTAEAQASGPLGPKNIVLFITDQEREIQHFPKDWARENLPNLERLRATGLTYENAFCCACMCSPSRASMLTGYFPAQHEVRYTLEENMPADQYPQVPLSTKLKNIGTVMAASGYDVIYKGKWHLSKPEGESFVPDDIEPYGFFRWDPPDAGANQSIGQAGGGVTDNDGRYMDSQGEEAVGAEGILQFIKTQAAGDQPFCLIVSLVNPHDVLLYPKVLDSGGYDDSWLDGEIELPDSVTDSLATKPRCQRTFRDIFAIGSGPLPSLEEKRNYINFYGNLMKSSDGYLGQVLDALLEQQLLDDTLIIRTSDHGEMGMAHGGLRQKVFNVYEETMRIPLIFSNPQMFPKPKTSKSMVSHVDLLPTLAGLVGAPKSARADWEGNDYSAQVLGTSSKPVQDYVVFTFDDTQCGQAHGPYVPPPGNIVSIREQRWKIAEYFDPTGKRPSTWEMYDLQNDPNEEDNLAFSAHRRTPEQEREYVRLRRKLRRVQRTRLQPLVGASFRLKSLVLDGETVESSVRIPGAGVVTQRVTYDVGDVTVLAAPVVREHLTGSGAKTISLSTTLDAAAQQLRAGRPIELSVRTSYLPPQGGASTTTDQLMAGRIPAFTG